MDELFELLKKLSIAAEDADVKKELEKFGIKSEMIKAIEKPTSFEDLLKKMDYQTTFDKKIAKALETRESSLKKEWKLDDNGKPLSPSSTEEDDEDEDLASLSPAMKAALKKIQDLGNKVEELSNENKTKSQEQIRQLAVKALSESSIPEVYVSKLDLTKPIEDQIEAVKTAFEVDKKSFFKSIPGLKLPKTVATDDNKPAADDVENLKKIM